MFGYMKNIKIYYGISGTLKRTTIESDLKKDSSSYAMWSMIKPWKDYEKGVFNNRLPYSDLNYANLHLCRLIDYVYQLPSGSEKNMLLVERGVSDMIFYWLKKNHQENENWIKSVVREEDFICDQNSYYIPDKYLLVMEDIEFIENVILREEKRKECFPGGVLDYLKQQNEYVDFTKKYNNIEFSKIVRIKSAKSYIEQTLRIEYDERKI